MIAIRRVVAIRLTMAVFVRYSNVVCLAHRRMRFNFQVSYQTHTGSRGGMPSGDVTFPTMDDTVRKEFPDTVQREYWPHYYDINDDFNRGNTRRTHALSVCFRSRRSGTHAFYTRKAPLINQRRPRQHQRPVRPLTGHPLFPRTMRSNDPSSDITLLYYKS